METILVVLDSRKLENPDLDIRYELPDKLEQYTHNGICDNGYDYLTNTELGIWLATKSAKENYGKLLEFIDDHMVCSNDLTGTVKIYISEKESAPLEECTLVYDGEEKIPDAETRASNRAKKSAKIILKIADLFAGNDNPLLDTISAKISELEDTSEQWQECVGILAKHHYICECDTDIKLQDFLEMSRELAVVKANDLPVEEDAFDDSQKLDDWCDTLERQWADAGFCLAVSELENGNDAVFFCKTEKVQELTELAKEISVYVNRHSPEIY